MFYRINLQYLPSVRLADSVVIEPPYVHRRRKADEYIVYLIKKGVMYLEENGETVTLQPGDMYVLDPRYIHVGVKASWCEYFYVHFRHPDMEPLEEETGLQKLLLENRQASVQSDIFSYEKCEGQSLYLPKSYHMHDYSSLVKVTELLNEAMERNITQLENYKILLACKVLEAFVEISRSCVTEETVAYVEKQPRSYRNVQELLNYLNREYAADITGQSLEKEFGGNFDYMNRTFKKVTGQTIFKYLNRVRINHAKALILNSPLKMSRIGESVGFPDEYYFSRVFKNIRENPHGICQEGMNGRKTGRPKGYFPFFFRSRSSLPADESPCTGYRDKIFS